VSEAYLEGVMELYQGEVGGEALFSVMAALATDPLRRHQFSVMLQFESETKVRLRPFLARLGLPLAEDERMRASARERGAHYAALPWAEFLAEFHASIGRYIADYEAIERLGPPSDQAVLHSMVEHEQAFLWYLERELAGDSRHSLDRIVGLLEHPLPA
jgi:hypothetical protein